MARAENYLHDNVGIGADLLSSAPDKFEEMSHILTCICYCTDTSHNAMAHAGQNPNKENAQHEQSKKRPSVPVCKADPGDSLYDDAEDEEFAALNESQAANIMTGPLSPVKRARTKLTPMQRQALNIHSPISPEYLSFASE
jgi:hypothetical protein